MNCRLAPGHCITRRKARRPARCVARQSAAGRLQASALPSRVPGRCRKTAERTVPDMAKTNTMNANISKEMRKEVYRRDGFRCALCDSTDGLQIHHVKPRGRGGADHPMNLITLCWRCHAAAHGSILLLDEYPSHDEFPNIEQQIQAIDKALRSFFLVGKIFGRVEPSDSIFRQAQI